MREFYKFAFMAALILGFLQGVLDFFSTLRSQGRWEDGENNRRGD